MKYVGLSLLSFSIVLLCSCGGGTEGSLIPTADQQTDSGSDDSEDDSGDDSSNPPTVTPANQAPEANNDIVSILEDTSLVAFDVLDNDVDPDGDDLTVVVASASIGEVSIIDGSAVNYVPEANFYGDVSVTVVISDGDLQSVSELVINVEEVNDIPDSRDDYYVYYFSQENGQSMDLDILANDTDIDGDTFTIASAEASAGSVEINTESISYTPPSTLSGIDFITYSITDENGASVSAIATIDVVPDDGYSFVLEWENPAIRIDGEEFTSDNIASYVLELRNVETEELEVITIGRSDDGITEVQDGDIISVEYVMNGLDSGFYQFSIQVVDDLGQLSDSYHTAALRIGG